MQDLREGFEATIVATSTTSGTGDFVLDGNVPWTVGPDRIPDGTRVWFHRYHADGVTAGSEWGYGEFDASTSPGPSIVNKVITRSSASPADSALSWGTDETHVAISASPDMMTQFAKIFGDMAPEHALCVAVSGQSNINFTPGTPGTSLDYPRLWDWSTDGNSSPVGSPETFDRSALSWRKWGGSDITNDWNGRYCGLPRTILFDNGSPVGSPEQIGVPNKSQAVYFCGELSQLSGRDVYVISAQSSGTQIDDPNYGWNYDPGSDNTAAWLSDEVANAIAAIPASAGVTAPHFMLFAQGGLQGPYYTTAEDAYLRSDFFNACFDPDRWGFLVDGISQILTVDWMIEESSFRRATPDYNGPAVACEMTGGRVQMIPATGLRQYVDTYDAAHFNEDGAAKLGRRMLGVAAQTYGNVTVAGATTHLNKGEPPVSVLNEDGIVATYTFGTASDSAPAAGQCHLNVAGDALLIADSVAGKSTRFSGIEHLRQNGAGDATAYIAMAFLQISKYPITGATKVRNGYFEVPVGDRLDVTSPGLTSGPAFLGFENCWVYRPDDFTASTTLPLRVPSEGVDNAEVRDRDITTSGALLRGDGRLAREHHVLRNQSLKTRCALGTTSVGLANFAEGGSIGDVYFFEVVIYGQTVGGLGIDPGYYVARRAFRQTAADQLTGIGSTDLQTIQDISGATVVITLQNVANGLAYAQTARVTLSVVGSPQTEIDFYADYTVRVQRV